jgi:uncharacterized protein (DUF58 family)
MRPTLRGGLLIALVPTWLYMAVEFGPRSLDAVVGPVVVALVAAALQVQLSGLPEIERQMPEPGGVGATRSVELTFDSGSPTAATIHDHVGPGLDATGNRQTTTIGAGPLSYELRLTKRGEHRIGPLDVETTDVLGLFARRFQIETTDSLLVYPPAYRLDPESTGLSVFSTVTEQHGSDEFAHLREYQRGDMLRDVHWKASAKQPDDGLLVGEYVDNRTRETLRIAVDVAEGDPDEVAMAAASIAVHLLDDGFEVGLTMPTETIEPDTGTTHRRAVLAALARLSDGTPGDDALDRADLVVSGDREVTVSMDRVAAPFGDIVATQGGDRVGYSDPIPSESATRSDAAASREVAP